MTFTKTLLTGALGLAVLVGSSGCDGFLDINTDPDAATAVPGSLLFPGVVADIGLTRAIEVGPGASTIAQQWAANGLAGVFSRPERYIISPFTTGNFWRSNYTGALKNLNLLIQQSESTEEGATQRPNEAAQAKIFSAFAYYELTILFEDIPFSQALNAAEFPFPEFDSQEQVLRGIVDLADEAIAQIDESDPNRIENGDVLYEGDLSEWIKLANSIKLQSLILLRGGGADVDGEIDALIANPNLIRENSSNAVIPFNDQSPNPVARLNQLFPFAYNYFYAGKPLVDLMNALEDPRREAYFFNNADAGLGDTDEACTIVENGNYVGIRAGGTVRPFCQASFVSRNFSLNGSPEQLVTAAQVLLLEAEYLASKGQLDQADAKYRQGIQASFDYVAAAGGSDGDFEGSSAGDYIDSLPSLTSLSSQQAVAAVVEQEYIALFSRGIDAWTLVRRTGDVGRIDRVLPLNAQLSSFLTRLPYPEANELTANPSAAAQPPLTQPMFFMRNAAGS